MLNVDAPRPHAAHHVSKRGCDPSSAACLACQGLTTIPTPRPRGSDPVCRRLPSTGSLGRVFVAYVRDPDGNKLCAIHRVK